MYAPSDSRFLSCSNSLACDSLRTTSLTSESHGLERVFLKRSPKTLTIGCQTKLEFWNKAAHRKEHKQLGRSPEFDRSLSRSSNISRNTSLFRKRWFFWTGKPKTLIIRFLSPKNLFEGMIELYHSIEQKELHKTLFLICFLSRWGSVKTRNNV